MTFEVHREPLFRRYYASYTSGACVYALLYSFVLIFLPLIIAYNTYDFWLQDKVVFEQPRVNYRYEAFVEVFGQTATGGPLNLFYSTSPTVNQLYGPNLRAPILQSGALDVNNDGLMDRLEVGLQMPLGVGESVYGFSAVFYHDVAVSARAKVLFDAINYVGYEAATPIGGAFVDGDLMVRQTQTLYAKGGFQVPYSGSPLISINSHTSARDVSIKSLLAQSLARNLSLSFNPSYAYAERTLPQDSNADKGLRFFNATLIMRVPVQGIRYNPPASEVFKWAWIQYISFFAVVSFLLFRLNSFLFRHQLIYTRPVADIVHEKVE